MKKLYFIAILFFIISYSQKPIQYFKNQGKIFGTYYHFSYEATDNLEQEIINELQKFNASLSTYDPNSVISKINKNINAELDDYFVKCFKKAVEVSEITDGAFDMTVAPVVNAWGFGFNESTMADSAKIDSLMQFVGFHKIKLVDNKIIKEHPETMLDASAIAKGFGVDVASEFLESKRIMNYMIEIGGEVRAKGINAKGLVWRIGIDKPIEDPTVSHRELQAVINLENKSLATSGNYRQFYEKDGIKYSHTIDPKTGYPARNQLLSATVLADDCMTADAFATAFMVMGINKSIELVNKINYLDAYFIYTDSLGNYSIYATPFLEKMLKP